MYTSRRKERESDGGKERRRKHGVKKEEKLNEGNQSERHTFVRMKHITIEKYK